MAKTAAQRKAEQEAARQKKAQDEEAARLKKADKEAADLRRTVNRLADDSKKWEDERSKLAADNKKLKEDFARRDKEQADRILALENTRSHGTPPANGGTAPPCEGTGDFFGGGPITAALGDRRTLCSSL